MSKPLIICGTGHRPARLGGYSDDLQLGLYHLATLNIKILRPDIVISGMALGWDFAIAQAAIDCGIPTWAYVPFTGHYSRWPKDTQKTYMRLLSQCSKLRVINRGGYEHWKMQARNEAMVNDSDAVLALWDGGTGGTANCCAYASQQGKPVYNVWSSWTASAEGGGA